MQGKVVYNRFAIAKNRPSIGWENLIISVEPFFNDHEKNKNYDPESVPEPQQLNFKKLNNKATTTSRATARSVSYDLYLAEKFYILMRSKGFVAIDIGLVPPKGI